VPDGYHYEITVDGRTVHCADPRLTDSQQELISLILHQGVVLPPLSPGGDWFAAPA
jgi:hypothetical protein